MDGGSSEGSEARFAAYVEALGGVLGHADRQQPMHDYCLGLLMPIDRKSVEPMAAVTAPGQSLPRRRPGSPQSINRCFILLATRRGRTRRC
jgi:SRSO17 transposase